MYNTKTAAYNGMGYNSLGEVEETHSAGSEGIMLLTAGGAGSKALISGNTLSVDISAEGQGIKAAEYGSETILKILEEGAGTKGAEGGAEARLILLGEGSGTKHAEGGAQSGLIVLPEGSGAVHEPRLFAGYTEEAEGRTGFSSLIGRVFSGHAAKSAGSFIITGQKAARDYSGYASPALGRLVRVATVARLYKGHIRPAEGFFALGRRLERLYQGHSKPAEGSYSRLIAALRGFNGHARVMAGTYLPGYTVALVARGHARGSRGNAEFLDITLSIIKVVKLEASLGPSLRQDFHAQRQDHIRVAFDISRIPYVESSSKIIWKSVDNYGHIVARKEYPGDMSMSRFNLDNKEALYFDLYKEDTNVAPGKYNHELRLVDATGNPSTLATGVMRIHPTWIDLTRG